MAMRSPLRPGERPLQRMRRRDREQSSLVFDDSYEIWLDTGAEDPRTGLDCYFQYLSNPAGKPYDTMHLPTVGNSRRGYDTNWEPVNRITPDGKAWEWELIIPRTSIFYDQPFSDGFEFGCLLARTYQRPFNQNAIGAISSFTAVEVYPRFHLSKTAPAVQLLNVCDFGNKTFGLHLAATGLDAEKLNWQLRANDLDKGGTLDLKPGERTQTKPMLDLLSERKSPFRITVTDQTGKVLMDWASQRRFGNRQLPTEAIDDPDNKVGLSPSFNPVHNYVRVTGDFIDHIGREAIADVLIEVLDSEGNVLAEATATVDDLAYVESVLYLKDLPYGQYQTRVTWRDNEGKTLGSRTKAFAKKDHKKEFPWWNTERGNIETVISPWTPVTYEDGAFGVWERTMKTGAAGLPRQIVAKGRDLLAAPVTLTAKTGKDTQLTLQPNTETATLFDEDYRKIMTFSGALGDLAVKSHVQVEFDGMYKVTLTLTPGKPTKVENLKLKVPFANQAAEYVHACGEGIRTGFYYGFLPEEERGRIWNCKTVDGQPMLKGSFIPYVWVGSPEGGLAWFADSDEGWVPNDSTPAIEIRRDTDDSTDFVLNLISEPFTIDAPRTITFAFQASPVKPMHEGWRMDSWWCGDTFKNFACAPHVIWTAIPYCRDIEKCRAMVEKQHKSSNSYIFGFDKYRANAVPYFIHQQLPGHLVPELGYFGDQWQTSVSECLYYGKTLTDYMVYNYSTWCEETGIDGFYVDNMRPVACDNIEAGRGYRLPDGRIQPTYQMFSTRRYFLRMRAAFAEQGKHNKIVLHMTNNMILPWVGAADIAYDGEHFVIYPEMNQDFMDKWSLERMRVDYPAQWGVAVNFMHEYQGKWDWAEKAKVFRAYTGMVGLHDALPSGNADGNNPPFWIGRNRFGIEQNDVNFVPYWDVGETVDSSNKDIYASVWKRPGKVLLLVVNKGEATDAELQLDLPALGLTDNADWQLEDAEANTRMARRKEILWNSADQKPLRKEGNRLIVPVERHDYRQVILSNE
jgi:hypothetical protein